jgi:hypothetical protein
MVVILRSEPPGNQMDLVDLIDVESRQAGGSQLTPNFIDRIRGVE